MGRATHFSVLNFPILGSMGWQHLPPGLRVPTTPFYHLPEPFSPSNLGHFWPHQKILRCLTSFLGDVDSLEPTQAHTHALRQAGLLYHQLRKRETGRRQSACPFDTRTMDRSIIYFSSKEGSIHTLHSIHTHMPASSIFPYSSLLFLSSSVDSNIFKRQIKNWFCQIPSPFKSFLDYSF